MSSMKSAQCLLALCVVLAPLHSLSLLVDPKYKNTTAGNVQGTTWPLLVPLDRESVPVRRNNVTVSHKTSYSGMISIGKPAQNFRMVFDTGSAHIVVPSSECLNETCVEHKRFNASKSVTSHLVNVDGSSVPDDELCDQVTIGYGTGMITGEFAKEHVCPGGASNPGDEACVDVNIVMAVDMTPLPFRSFTFDGIFGLALDSLALSPEFSFFHNVANSKSAASPQFGVFLTDGENGQESEIALGGHNSQRTLTPLKWAPVAMPEHGYWQVSIKEVRIGGVVLDICKDGTCRGIVDSGTSHLGVPGSHMNDFMDQLAVDTNDPTADCRSMEGKDLEIVLQGEIALTLDPEHYMRPLSLASDTSVATEVASTNTTMASLGAENHALVVQQSQPRTCAPRLMPVNLPEPLGPKLFILGEPLLHRYYTVYDWSEKQVGFGLAASNINKRAMAKGKFDTDETIISFMQVTVKLTMRGCKSRQRLPAVPALAAPSEL